MDNETKRKLFTWLYVVLILVVIGTCIFMMYYLTGDGTKCLADPIQYYSEKTGQQCFCNAGGMFAPTG